jgi:hypothetical protein
MPSQTMPKINLLQMPDPAARTAKYVNMMNATKQQEAAEQTLKLQQEKAAREEAMQAPALAAAKSEADIKKLDFMMQFYKATANDIANSSTPDEVVARAERLKQQFPVPELQARVDETVANLVSDPSRFEENRKRILTRTLDAKDQFAVTHSDIFDAEGNLYLKRTSPIGAFETEITPGLETDPSVTSAPRAETPRTPVVSAPAAPPRTPTAAPQQTPSGARPLTPDQQDHIRRMQEELGMTNTPASFTRGGAAAPTVGQMTPDMVPAILDSAINTGVMAQIDLDQMLAMTPPQARDGIMKVIRDSKIALQADAPSLAVSAMPQQQPMAPNPVGRQQPQFADMRGPAPQASFADLGGQPQMQNMMAQYQVGKQIKGRNQNIPPSANVAPQVLGSQRAAETAGSENVKVGTEPRIVAGTERAKRLEKLRGEMPIAQAETQTLVTNLTGRINAIDEYLRSGSRNSIIGAVEGRIPRLFQSETRSDAQGVYDYITSNTVLQKLIDDRGQTESGGSPQGVVSDADLKVAAQASTKLTQTGSERKQEIEMQRLRDELYRTREQAIQKYNNVYREVMKEAPELRLKVRTVAPKYKSAPQTPTRAKSLQNIFGG